MTTESWATRPEELVEVERPGGLAERRRHALADAVDDVLAQNTLPSRGSCTPAVSTRSYGQGCLALALGGDFDRNAVRALQRRMDGLGPAASVEFVVAMSSLTSCGPPLARYLARLRLQRLLHGARVELHDAPADLTLELGQSPPEVFTVVDDEERGPGEQWAVTPTPPRTQR